jgi:hypothetical protein
MGRFQIAQRAARAHSKKGGKRRKSSSTSTSTISIYIYIYISILSGGGVIIGVFMIRALKGALWGIEAFY